MMIESHYWMIKLMKIWFLTFFTFSLSLSPYLSQYWSKIDDEWWLNHTIERKGWWNFGVLRFFTFLRFTNLSLSQNWLSKFEWIMIEYTIEWSVLSKNYEIVENLYSLSLSLSQISRTQSLSDRHLMLMKRWNIKTSVSQKHTHTRAADWIVYILMGKHVSISIKSFFLSLYHDHHDSSFFTHREIEKRRAHDSLTQWRVIFVEQFQNFQITKRVLVS